MLAMDTSNLEDLSDLLPPGSGATLGPACGASATSTPCVGDGDDDRDVPDPYYGAESGFDDVLAMVERTSEALTARPGPDPRRDAGLNAADTVAPPSA